MEHPFDEAIRKIQDLYNPASGFMQEDYDRLVRQLRDNWNQDLAEAYNAHAREQGVNTTPGYVTFPTGRQWLKIARYPA